jgi:FdhD protein
LISRTAPNAASIQSAEEAGITLIGYARRDQFQLYTHPERIAGAPAGAHFPLALIYQEDPAGPD